MSQTEAQAKRFFVEAIVSQARREGTALSDNERWMLGFSESDPDFALDSSRMSEFEAETTDQEYEAKIAGLIRRAYEHDVSLDSETAAIYRDARDSLRRGDHYLLVMIDQALAARLQPGPVRAFVKTGVFLILLPATALAVLLAAGLGGGLVLAVLKTRELEEAGPFLAGFLAFAGISWWLVRLLVREARS